MIRRLAPLALLAMAACSNDGTVTSELVAGFLLDEIAPGILADAPEEAAPARELTRAELDQIPFATIALSVEDSPRAFVVPLADNGGYLTYMDATRRGIVMQGGAITGTLGLGIDLNGVRNAANDPVARPTPLAEWPGQVYRNYQYKLRDGKEYSISLTCIFERVARERIEIVERRFEVVRIAETCTNRARQVVNQHWVAPETGFIWKTTQWVSPQQPPLTVEIIRPYSPS
ncbi:MAG: YjbF family lipoprotein [Pseudomonadota bacterium]